MPIPNNLHFIWAGGAIIPEQEKAVVKEWSKKNPAYKVFLWIDEATTPADDIKKLQTELTEYINIEVIDITKGEVNEEAITIELKKPRKLRNYGISSDRLRYNILYKYGGCYLDCDVYPTDTPLPVNINSKHGILLSPWAQNTFKISNDILFCETGNPIMRELIKSLAIDKDYFFWRDQTYSCRQKFSTNEKAALNIYEYEDQEIRAQRTLEGTGPGILKKHLMHLGALWGEKSELGENYNPIYEPFFIERFELGVHYHVNSEYLLGNSERTKPPYFTTPKDRSNTASWVLTKNQTQEKARSREELISDAVTAIQYEIKNWKIFRLNDYASALAAELNDNPLVIAKSLVVAILKTDITNMEACQFIPFLDQDFGQELFNKFLDTAKKNNLSSERIRAQISEHLRYMDNHGAHYDEGQIVIRLSALERMATELNVCKNLELYVHYLYDILRKAKNIETEPLFEKFTGVKLYDHILANNISTARVDPRSVLNNFRKLTEKDIMIYYRHLRRDDVLKVLQSAKSYFFETFAKKQTDPNILQEYKILLAPIPWLETGKSFWYSIFSDPNDYTSRMDELIQKAKANQKNKPLNDSKRSDI